MIVDCYTHTWDSIEQLGRCVPPEGLDVAQARVTADPQAAGPTRHWSAAAPVQTTCVLGFTSQYLDAEIPNDRIAAYVSQHPDRLVGFASIDPSDPKAASAELARARDELGMRGVVVSPAAQGFHPSNSQAMLVFAEVAQRSMPIVFTSGVHIAPASKLEYAQPVLLDEIARELPGLRIVIAHMGYPWTHETIVLLGKHPNVYAEISWLLQQPWQAYQALHHAHQYGVMDKLLFGSGFPFAAASQCIESLYSINHLVHGTSLPTIPREQLRGIVERDALGLLGIAEPRPGRRTPQPVPVGAEEDGEES
jgi:hypothetical protein